MICGGGRQTNVRGLRYTKRARNEAKRVDLTITGTNVIVGPLCFSQSLLYGRRLWTLTGEAFFNNIGNNYGRYWSAERATLWWLTRPAPIELSAGG